MIFLLNKTYLLIFKILKKLKIKSKYFIISLSSKEILERNYKKGYNFSFIQVGANDGKSFDFLYEFVSNRKSKGIVIEPIAEYFDELDKNYAFNEQIITINKAIHPVEKKVTLYKVNPNNKDKYPEWVKGIASLDPNHHKKLNVQSDDMIEEEVEAIPLMNVISSSLKNNRLDYFQVDTEGFDYDVIKMLNFNVVQPKIIKYESVNLKEEQQVELISFFKSKGYYVFKEVNDTLAINLKNTWLR